MIGAGPTGVELAGTLAEIARHTLRQEFRHFDPRQAQVRLIEAGPAPLASFPPELQQRTRAQLEKLGVERRLLTAGENKGMLDPFSPQNERQTAYAKAMIGQIHDQFIKTVRDGRGDRLKETPETFSGLFWNGEEAVKLGLADAFGNLDFVAREVVKAEHVVDYTPQENVAERLVKRFGASVGQGAVRSLRQLAPIH